MIYGSKSSGDLRRKWDSSNSSHALILLIHTHTFFIIISIFDRHHHRSKWQLMADEISLNRGKLNRIDCKIRLISYAR